MPPQAQPSLSNASTANIGFDVVGAVPPLSAARGNRANISNYGLESNAITRRGDVLRWAYSVPPKGIANFAWVQPFISYLAPQLVSFKLC